MEYYIYLAVKIAITFAGIGTILACPVFEEKITFFGYALVIMGIFISIFSGIAEVWITL